MKTTTKTSVRLSGRRFAAIKDVEQRKKVFLQYISSFYHRGNRATKEPDFAHPSTAGCQYSSSKTSPGCAIGQFLSKTAAKQLDCLRDSSIRSAIIASRSLNIRIPRWITDMDANFLVRVQQLHDYSHHWTTSGLSKCGRAEVTRITKEFKLS